EAEERVDRCEPGIACSCRVAALLLQMLQECQDERCIDRRRSRAEAASSVHTPRWYAGLPGAPWAGCGQLLMFRYFRNSVLVDLLPELFPPAFRKGESSQAE